MGTQTEIYTGEFVIRDWDMIEGWLDIGGDGP